MNDIDLGAFKALFKEACLKCFGHPAEEPLTETESKLLYHKIFEDAGLVVGWKSLKNYSFYLFSDSPGKQENPSVATLDTLSRYAQGVPYTTEAERKKSAGHYPYWYGYREQWVLGRPIPAAAGQEGMAGLEGHQTGGDVSDRQQTAAGDSADRVAGGSFAGRVRSGWWLAGGIIVVLAFLLIALTLILSRHTKMEVKEDFRSLSVDSLTARGWWVASQDSTYWSRRGEQAGCLTLYTLKGDNWPDPMQAPVIRNLLLRHITCDCFTLELHLQDFIPRQNWQQAGILLLEDTGFAGKSLRVSIAYNDFNGVYPRSGSILVQAITAVASGKPEEIAHVPLFSTDSLLRNPALARNLAHSAIRIEKEGSRVRILYADGILTTTSFKEIAVYNLAMQPRFVGVFALKGFVDSATEIPARFNFFGLDCGCGK